MAYINPVRVPSMSGPSLDSSGPEFPSQSAGVMAAADPSYGLPVPDYGMDGVTGAVMADAAGGVLQESGYAHDLSAGAVAPYYPGAVSPVYAGGDNDAGGRDIAAGSVAGSVAASAARLGELMSDASGAPGGTIGDLVTFPPNPVDPGDQAAVGLTFPAGAFYDPPRSY